jgi:hypothetical protein
MVPYRGRLVVAETPRIAEWFGDESEPPVYWFPHGDTVVHGGTAVANWIVTGCAATEPRFSEVRGDRPSGRGCGR